MEGRWRKPFIVGLVWPIGVMPRVPKESNAHPPLPPKSGPEAFKTDLILEKRLARCVSSSSKKQKPRKPLFRYHQ